MINLDIYRRAVVLCSALLFALMINAQQSTIHTSGGNILGVCGDTIVLRGINYAPFDWGYDNTQLLLDQVAQTGANAVRMSWYDNSGGAPYYTDDLLDTAIATCIRNKMIPIIELHDLTCDGNTPDVDTLINWYTTPTRVAMFNKYQSSLIIDIANEVGYVHWAGNESTGQQQYQQAYETAVTTLRTAGINVPLMIDAPDCGSSIDILGNVASPIITADPLHNIIFSSHAYWYAYANNDSATMAQDLATALTFNYPLVLGEIANYQDSSPAYCTWALNYPALLHSCMQMNVGFMAWSWNNDQCSSRQLSNDGTYANLSTYGQDMVNNTSYGLHHSARLTSYLKNGVCQSTTGIESINPQKPYTTYNDNGLAYIRSLSNTTLQYQCFDMLGRLVQQAELAPYQIASLPAIGVGLMQVTDQGRQSVARFVSTQ